MVVDQDVFVVCPVCTILTADAVATKGSQFSAALDAGWMVPWKQC